MELNVTENLEKSVLLPLYTHENEINSDAFKLMDSKGIDTSKFYLDGSNKFIPGSNIPFYTEVELKAKKQSLEMTKDFFVKSLPKFFKNIPEDAIYGIFKGIENGVGNTTAAFPGLKEYVDEIATMNIAPEPFNMSLRQLSEKVHNLDAERDKTFANDLAGYMFQAMPYLFLARSRLIQGGIGIPRANMLAWMIASGMGFKNEELLVSDLYAKSLGDSKFMKSLKEFDDKYADSGVSLEGLLDFVPRAADGYLFEKIFQGIREVYKYFKVSQMSPKEKYKYLGDEKNVKELSEGMVKQQDKPLKFFPDQDDVNTAQKVIKNLDNPSDEVIETIKQDKNVKEVIESQKKGELVNTKDKFMNPDWQETRKFTFDGNEVIGFNNAIKTYYGSGATKKDKIAHIIIGAPASGKSTKANVISEHFGSKIIDSDDFKFALTGKKNTSLTSAVHEEGKYLANSVVNMATDNGDNIVLPIIGHNQDKVFKHVDLFQNKGYKIKLVFAEAPTNTTRMKNIKRALVTGRMIPDEYFSQDLNEKIKFVYDVVSPNVDDAATIKTGTLRKNAIIETEKKGSGIY